MNGQATIEDVLAALAIVTLERDAMRDRDGLPSCGMRRTFTAEDLARGRSVGPLVWTESDGSLTVVMES